MSSAPAGSTRPPYSIRKKGSYASDIEPIKVQFDQSSLNSQSKEDESLGVGAEMRREWRQSVRYVESSARTFKERFLGRDRWVSWAESWKNIALCSMLNVLLILIPIAWGLHAAKANPAATFVLSFLAIIPLENLFDFGGEQMSHYLGKQLGDLCIITLNNAVEATLAIVLLLNGKCELKLLQTTITGVVVLHLLLIPGMAFLTGGARIWEQNLHAHPTQLNHSLLTLGVLAIVLPTAMFAALEPTAGSSPEETPLTNAFRQTLLDISRIMAFALLVVYVCSRVYLYNPEAEEMTAPESLKRQETELAETKPEVNVWSCMILLAVTIAVMGVTAEFLVEAIEPVRHTFDLTESWFGLILLPFVSFSGDAVVATIYFLQYTFRIFFRKPEPPADLAKGRAIDMAIQFLIFWLPVLVLLGWCAGKPFHLMFDYFEVALLLGACFLVNYITADAKTNWAEGLIMCAFYFMIAVVVFRYEGQGSAEEMLACHKVGLEIAAEGSGQGNDTETGGTGESHEASGSPEEIAAKLLVRAVAKMMSRREL